MDKFAKLYDFEDLGQVLIVIDQSDDEDCVPSIKVSSIPSENLGVCSTSFKYEDNDEGWDKARAAFDSLTKADAYKIALRLRKELDAMMGS